MRTSLARRLRVRVWLYRWITGRPPGLQPTLRTSLYLPSRQAPSGLPAPSGLLRTIIPNVPRGKKPSAHRSAAPLSMPGGVVLFGGPGGARRKAANGRALGCGRPLLAANSVRALPASQDCFHGERRVASQRVALRHVASGGAGQEVGRGGRRCRRPWSWVRCWRPCRGTAEPPRPRSGSCCGTTRR